MRYLGRLEYNNGDLDDEGENITVSGGPDVFIATITPPSNAFEGSCMLRIRIHSRDDSTEPCGNSLYGEVEDYMINVVPAPVSPTFNVTPAIKKYIDSPLNHFTPDYFMQTFTVKNIGSGTLTISNVILIGGNDTQFVLTDTHTYPIGLTGTSTIQFTVKFNPTSIGPKATTLRIQSSGETNHDVALSGTGFVYPPLNLSALITPANTNELSWDPPLPEGEIRYDNGVPSDWFTPNYPSGADDYAFTRFTAPVNGNLNYVALFQKEDEEAPDWPKIMVCPEYGTSNTPDLNNPLATFSDVPVNSFDGEWKILELTPSSILTAGTDFFLVVHWPPDTYPEPYVIADILSNTNRCRYSTDSSTWEPYSGTYLMRAYMSTTSERSVYSYNILRGTSETSLADYVTGITTTNYTDSDVFPSTTYFYGITALNSDSQLSDTSNIISLTTADAFDNLYIWTGNVNTEWNNAGNWDSGIVPDATIKVIIPSNPVSTRFPVINDAVNCYNINIGPGAFVTVQSSGVLNINNP